VGEGAGGGGGDGERGLEEGWGGVVRVCVFITAGPSTKLIAVGGGDIGGHVLRQTTSRFLCGLV
jgi:hypothetical protein